MRSMLIENREQDVKTILYQTGKVRELPGGRKIKVTRSITLGSSLDAEKAAETKGAEEPIPGPEVTVTGADWKLIEADRTAIACLKGWEEKRQIRMRPA